MSDADIKTAVGGMAVPEFETTAFTTPTPLGEARVAIVTTAALHHGEDEQFERADTGFRILDGSRHDVVLGHWSPNFDRSGFAADINVVYPIDRLAELADRGLIGSVASHHIAFAGNQDETMTSIRLDSGPAAAKMLLDDDVDVVLLTPV
jgi:D-proline reductase (dithiol) PrdB